MKKHLTAVGSSRATNQKSIWKQLKVGRRVFFGFLIGSMLTAIGSTQGFAQTTLGIGDIYITGFNANAPDGFGFVVLRDIAAGTDIRFTDNGFLASVSATASNNGRGGENFLRWIAPAGGLTAGTVVTYVTGVGMGTVSNGTLPSITGNTSGMNNLAGGGDQIFIYQGGGTGSSNTTIGFGTNANPTTFTGTILNGLNFQGTDSSTSWLTTGTASSNTSYLPTQLSGLNANTNLAASASRGNYTGVRTGLTASVYGHALSNASNWTTASGTGVVTLTSTNFTVGSSANLSWDANGTTVGSGGTGTWDISTQSRFSSTVGPDTSFMPWVNSTIGNSHTAVFGGTAGTVSVAASGVTASGLDFQTTGYTVQSNTITLSGASPTINAGTNVSATVSSVLAGSEGLNKTGAGTVILTGANTYTGTTTISGGSLLVNNDPFLPGSGTGVGAVSVQTGGTLGGSGVIQGNTTIASTGIGTLSPGSSAATVGLISFTNDLTLNSGSIFNWELTSNTSSPIGARGTDFDAVNVGGALTVVDATSNLTFASGVGGVQWDDIFWSTDKTWNVFTGATSLSFGNLAIGSLTGGTGTAPSVSAFSWVPASSGFGVNLQYTAVPEPTSLVFGFILGTSGIIAYRRRKTKAGLTASTTA